MPIGAGGLYYRVYTFTIERDANKKVEASAVDEEFDGLVNVLNDMINGSIEYKGTIKIQDGTEALPGLAFFADTDTGVYRIGDNNIGISAGGSKKIDIALAGVTMPDLTTTNITVTGTASLDAPTLNGENGEYYLNASNLNAGTVPADRLSGTYNITADNADKVDNIHANQFVRNDVGGQVVQQPLMLDGSPYNDLVFRNPTGSHAEAKIQADALSQSLSIIVYDAIGTNGKSLLMKNDGTLQWDGNRIWRAGDYLVEDIRYNASVLEKKVNGIWYTV